MKRITTRFEYDPSLDHIEVIVRASEKDDRVTELLENFYCAPANDLLAYDDDGNVRTLIFEDIILVSVFRKDLVIVTENGKFHTRKSLQNLEKELDPDVFIRVSRYEIVNIRKILQYDFSLPGTLRIELVNGMETWASRRCIPLIRKWLMGKEGSE